MITLSLILVGTLIRYFYIFKIHLAEKYIFSDMGGYYKYAQDFLADTINKSFFFQPIGLPLIEAFSLNLNGDLEPLKWIQFISSTLTLFIIYRISQNVFKSQETSSTITLPHIVLAISVFHFPFIFYSGVFLSENIFTFFLSLFILCLSEFSFPFNLKQSFLIALSFSLAFIIKTSAILIIPLMFIWSLAKCYQDKKIFFQTIKSLCLIFFVFTGSLVLHGLWSQNKIGHFLLTPTSGGLNFIEGKCPSKENKDSTGASWLSPLFAQTQEFEKKYWDTPFTDSQFYTRQALTCIFERPQVLIESLRYVPYLIINNDMWPSLNTLPDQKMLSRNYSLYFALLLIPGLIWAFFILTKKIFDPNFLILIIPALSVFLIVWLFKSENRFRVPFDLVFIPILVLGWSHCLKIFYPHYKSESINRFMFYFTITFGVFFISSLIN